MAHPKSTINWKPIFQKNGRTSKWVASQIGITPNLLSQYVTGHRTMPPTIEAKLKDLLEP